LSDRSTGVRQILLQVVRGIIFFNYCAAIDARQHFCQLMRGNISVN
jgi:hypothetical protein